MLKYKYIFRIKYTEAILSDSTRKLLWFEITKMLTAVEKNNSTVSFVIIFGTLSFPITPRSRRSIVHEAAAAAAAVEREWALPASAAAD